MLAKKLPGVLLSCLLLMLSVAAFSQNKTITGKILDSKKEPVSGASITPKGSSGGTTTNTSGDFTITVPENTTELEVSYIGFVTQSIRVVNQSTVSVTLVETAGDLGEVVVIGYGTTRRSDLTGAVASVKPKDFNQGIQVAPDQLIQGKVAGVQVINNSGQPGGATTFRIRGNSSLRSGNQPLFVIDGVIVDATSARPGVNAAGLGATPDANPLNFLNPNDIASMDILKDASATAIYGSRGANGVVIITTRKGAVGAPRLDFQTSVGVSKIMRNIDVLDGNEYRSLLNDYGITTGNFGQNVDAFDEILQSAMTTNNSVGFSGGNEFSRYRLSASYLDQEGIVIGTGLKKITAGFTNNLKLLNNRKLNLDFNIIASQVSEKIGAISEDAGFTGNILSTSLQWNPTRPLYKPDGTINNYFDGTTVNPVELRDGYRDRGKTNTVVGSISPSYKITNDLEYKLSYGFVYSNGERRTSIRNWVNFADIGINNQYPEGRGWANLGNTELVTQTLTQTLNYTKKLSSSLGLKALIGYEYYRKDYKGNNLNAKDFGTFELDYTDILQSASNNSKRFWSFHDPEQKLRSYFARLEFDYEGKYLLTGTFRADGSSKFGSNNRYGYFPSFAAAWNIHNEDFFSKGLFSQLKLRAGYGITGNQEFPSGAALSRFNITEEGNLTQNQQPNADLQWQEDQQLNIGVDFAMFKGRLTGTVDYFDRKTSKLLFPTVDAQPTAGSLIWKNLDGQVRNSGVEITLNGTIVEKEDFTWDMGTNITFVKNKVSGIPAPIQTGALHGQGMSGTTVQLIANGQPINAYYTRDFLGIDAQTGQASFVGEGNVFSFMGNPNPTTLVGIYTTLAYKKLSLSINMNGSYGHLLYNNTANAVLPIGNLGTRNVAANLVGLNESLSSPITSSSRYLEKGDYLKLANATLNYNIGKVGNVINNLGVFVTGQNLFVLTDYNGFDPEVNTDKQVNGIPSVGIDYIGYPSARTIILGLNISF